MNIFFGIAGKVPPSECETFRTKIESIYGISCQIIHAGDAGFAICSSDSLICGVSEQERQKIVLFGAVHKPVAEWNKAQSPLDDPSGTADHFLYLWRKYGKESPGMAAGSFAGCMLDQENEKAYIFSDPDGMRNLYYYSENGRIWFSSNPKVLAVLCPDIRIDRSLEDFFLVYGFWPDGRTAYKDVYILPPGTVIENTAKGQDFHRVQRKPFKDFPGHNFDFSAACFEDAVDALYQAFMQAVSDQTAGEGGAAVLLGGVDSALVASCLHKLGKKVETFSFYYDDETFNQPHADTLSTYLGIRHNWVRITPGVILEGHKDWAFKFCQPTNWANYVIQTHHLCKKISEKGFKRCYSGDGCDSTFFGYPNVHKSSSFYAQYNRFPKWFLWLALFPMRYAVSEYLIGRLYTVGCNALRSLGRRGPERGFLTFKVMDEFSLSRLRKGPAPIQECSVEDKLKELARKLSDLSVDRLAYTGKNFVSPNKAKMNGCMDNCNMTVLSPYLHPILKKLVHTIPDDLLRPQGLSRDEDRLGKYILLKMIQKYNLLPDSIIFQRKIAAVDAPVDLWYSKDIKKQIQDIAFKVPFECNRTYINFLHKAHPADKFYVKYFCSDRVTSHAISLLSTYATYADNLN